MFRWWRKLEDLELWEVLRRRRTRALANHNPRALDFAVERCAVCRQAEECKRLLAADWDSGIEELCPNTMYLRHLDAMRRHALKSQRPEG